jgi:two-component system CheB/CheR fusion protein
MIYMRHLLQKRILPLFHYALNPNGILFLGSSETVGGFTDLFIPLDKKYKIYTKKTVDFPVDFGFVPRYEVETEIAAKTRHDPVAGPPRRFAEDRRPDFVDALCTAERGRQRSS